MKTIMVIAILCCSISLYAEHTQQEEIAVVQDLCRMLQLNWEWNVEPETRANTNLAFEKFNKYEDLFADPYPIDIAGAGWTPLERQAAFEHFIENIPVLSTNGACRNVKSHASIALGYCESFGRTNALPVAIRILESKDSAARNTALSIFERFAVPTIEINRKVEHLLKDVIPPDDYLRKYLIGAYAQVLQTHINNCSYCVLTNGVSVLKSGVYGWSGAVAIDKLLLKVFPTYECSSNRLAAAELVLASNFPEEKFWDWKSAMNEYFEPITNKLMKAAQPLSEVEALRGL